MSVMNVGPYSKYKLVVKGKEKVENVFVLARSPEDGKQLVVQAYGPKLKFDLEPVPFSAGAERNQ